MSSIKFMIKNFSIKTFVATHIFCLKNLLMKTTFKLI